MNALSALLDLLTVAIALAIVLALAFFSLKLLKRAQTGRPGASDEIRYVRALPVGPRERLTLVEYRDEILLLGVTAGQIAVIDRRPRPVAEPADAQPPAFETPAPGPLPASLRRLLGKTLARERPNL
jgi:flagellar biosynthetic protein FliO